MADKAQLRRKVERLKARVAELEKAIVTGGAMLRAERAALGVPGGLEPELDSPAFTPQAVADLEARGFERVNRFKKEGTDA